jgi:hypothetical protein
VEDQEKTLSGLTPYQILALIYGSMKLDFLPVSKKYHHLMEDPITKMNTNQKRSAFFPQKGNFHHPPHKSFCSLSQALSFPGCLCECVASGGDEMGKLFDPASHNVFVSSRVASAPGCARSLDIYIKVIWASNCSTVWPLGSVLATNDRCK